jgi:hypothetical protein
MIRIPIPIVLAAIVVLGAATIYFYVTVVSNPVYGAWSDQGTATTYQYTVPAGQWIMLGTFGGSSITISSNVSMNLRAQAFTVQAWANTLLPPGTWQVIGPCGSTGVVYGYLKVNTGNTYSLGDNVFVTTCSSASVIKLSNGMYMYYPNYTASGADCSNQLPLSSYTISSTGSLNAYGVSWPVASCASSYAISANNVYSYTINPQVFSYSVGQGNSIYYIYFRPVYTIWVSPSANATITVTVSP